jgi:hypothetical protein
VDTGFSELLALWLDPRDHAQTMEHDPEKRALGLDPKDTVKQKDNTGA